MLLNYSVSSPEQFLTQYTVYINEQKLNAIDKDNVLLAFNKKF